VKRSGSLVSHKIEIQFSSERRRIMFAPCSGVVSRLGTHCFANRTVAVIQMSVSFFFSNHVMMDIKKDASDSSVTNFAMPRVGFDLSCVVASANVEI
jgi:hypothetical protein